MSVSKRGGVFWYEFVFQGQRVRESTGLSNKTAALRAEAIRKAEFAEGRAGIVRHKPRPTFEEFVTNEFLPWSKKEHEAKPRTHDRYQTAAKPLTAAFGKLPLDAISMGHVEKFKISRAGDISPAGTNRDLAMLRFMLNFAVRQGHIVSNPVIGVRFLKEGPGCMRVVSHDEQQRYMAAASPLLRDVSTLIVEMGLCPEEVFTIRKENVHLDKGYVFVPIGKTKFRRRNAPITKAAGEVLRLRKAQAKGSYLFPHRHDPEKPLTDVHKAHQEALGKITVKPLFRLYDFRHTFGSRMAMAGVDLPH